MKVPPHIHARQVIGLVLTCAAADEELRWHTQAVETDGSLAFAGPAYSVYADSTSPTGYPLQHARTKTVEATPGAQAQVRHLRERSGLTWDQLARVLQVDRRSLHNWNNGAAMHVANEERLRRVNAVVDFIDRGFADQTAKALMLATPDGGLVLDWLAEGRDDQVKALLGRGAGMRPDEPRVSEDERQRRRPPSIAALLDARHEVAHIEIGKSRIVGKVRGPA